MQIIPLLKRLFTSHRKSRKIANEFVKKYYKENRNKNFPFTHNVWSKNIYWDYFLQSLPHSVQSKYYVPRDFYAIELEPKLKTHLFSDFIREKNYFDKLFSNFDIILPKTYIHCINYTLLDKDYSKIKNPKEILEKIDSDVITKSATGGSGMNILKFIKTNGKLVDASGENLDLAKLSKFYNGNFLIQERISQHADIAKFHPGTLNTIRAITYRSFKDNEIYVLSTMLRIGQGKSVVDNISAGGIAVSISVEENGKFCKYAFDKNGNYWLQHPETGITFEGAIFPHYETIIKQLTKLGYYLGHSRIIGWDVSINQEGKMILIEQNVGIGTWMSQIADGRPLFGKFSEEVYDFIKNKKGNCTI